MKETSSLLTAYALFSYYCFHYRTDRRHADFHFLFRWKIPNCSVLFTMTADTLVRDAVEAAVDEWGVGFQNSELSCAGVVLPELSTLVSHGIEGGTQLEVLDGVLGCSFEDMKEGSGKIEELLQSCDEEGFLSSPDMPVLCQWL